MENETNTPILLIQKPQEMIRLFEQLIDEKLKAFAGMQPQAVAPSFADENPASPFLNSSQVQQIFNVSRQTINDWRKSGLLQSFKIKSRRYFFKEQVDQLRNRIRNGNTETK